MASQIDSTALEGKGGTPTPKWLKIDSSDN
jgi:hypothetical protein